jgi:hypothetical protein
VKALIVGAGIAGPVTAMALQKAGIDAASWKGIGSTAGTSGRTLGLARTGSEPSTRSMRLDVAKAEAFAHRRNVLRGELGHGPRRHRRRTIARGRHDVAHDEADEAGTAPGRRGESDAGSASRAVGACECRQRAATGSSPRSMTDRRTTADLLIGADGIHSVVRRLIDPQAPGWPVRRAHELRWDHAGRRRRRRRISSGDLAVRLRSARVLRRAAGTGRRHRLVRQRAAGDDQSRGACDTTD